MNGMGSTPWQTARASNQGNCVEVRGYAGRVEVRDTKDRRTESTLDITCSAFEAWVDGAKNGEFDHLIK